MKNLSHDAVTKAHLDEVDARQSRQIGQLRVALGLLAAAWAASLAYLLLR
jgi:hypothetical protein